MAKVNLLSQKEYAEHRGCSPAAVNKAIGEGRISTIDGKIDPVVADIQWEANTRARVRKATPTPTAAPVSSDTTAQADGEQLPLGGESPRADAAEGDDAGEALAADPKYQASRATREEASARREWLRLLEDEKKLIRIDQVQAELAARLAPVREAFMQLPSRIAPLIAAESDAAKIQNNLEAEIHAILARLAAA